MEILATRQYLDESTTGVCYFHRQHARWQSWSQLASRQLSFVPQVIWEQRLPDVALDVHFVEGFHFQPMLLLEMTEILKFSAVFCPCRLEQCR